MRSQFVVLMASGLGSWPDSSRLRTYSASTTASIPTSGRAGSGLDQAFHTTAVDMRACGSTILSFINTSTTGKNGSLSDGKS